jgi:hypothetical protein
MKGSAQTIIIVKCSDCGKVCVGVPGIEPVRHIRRTQTQPDRIHWNRFSVSPAPCQPGKIL